MTSTEMTVEFVGITVVAARNGSWDGAGTTGYEILRDAIAIDYTYGLYAAPVSGDGYAVFVSDDVTGNVGGVEYARVADTTMPTSGSATFAGGYAGWLLDGPNAGYFVNGDASLSADFANATIGGTISNRQWASAFYTFGDLTLEQSSIVDGAFDGTTSGGSSIGAPNTVASAGTYSGLIVGANGDEVVGAIMVPHDQSGTPYTELGVFFGD